MKCLLLAVLLSLMLGCSESGGIRVHLFPEQQYRQAEACYAMGGTKAIFEVRPGNDGKLWISDAACIQESAKTRAQAIARELEWQKKALEQIQKGLHDIKNDLRGIPNDR